MSDSRDSILDQLPEDPDTGRHPFAHQVRLFGFLAIVPSPVGLWFAAGFWAFFLTVAGLCFAMLSLSKARKVNKDLQEGDYDQESTKQVKLGRNLAYLALACHGLAFVWLLANTKGPGFGSF